VDKSHAPEKPDKYARGGYQQGKLGCVVPFEDAMKIELRTKKCENEFNTFGRER
jgi:hypothetical protein